MKSISENEKLLEKRGAQLETLSYIAKTHGSLLSLEDAASLTRVGESTSTFDNRLRHRRQSSEYHVRDGFFVETADGGQPEELAAVSKALDMKARAAQYVKHAREFATLDVTKSAILFAVSGSTSYKSVSDSDDLDFFCITRKDSLWAFIAKNLLLARFYKRNSPRICFSYAVDESFALAEFSHENDALFARDALTTIVLRGNEYYRALLSHARWMSKYFSRAYEQRIVGLARDWNLQPRTYSFRTRFLNLTLHFLVGRYIALKSNMLNRNFARRGNFSSIFTARIGVDHCIFESARYAQLRSMYRGFDEGNDRGARQSPQSSDD